MVSIGCADSDGLAAVEALVGPEVIPVGAGGEVDLAGGAALLGDGGYEEGWSEHVPSPRLATMGCAPKSMKRPRMKGAPVWWGHVARE